MLINKEFGRFEGLKEHKMSFTKMYRYVISTGFLLLFTVTLSPVCFAAGYYVSITGNDYDPGSQNKPWRTIQKAADTMTPGDSCLVAPGDYDEKVSVTRSGNQGGRISFVAGQPVVKTRSFYISADYIRVKGFMVEADECNSAWGYGVKLTGDHCIIEDNYAYYCPRGGITLTSEADHNVIRDNDCYRNGLTGISVDGTYNLCENNEIWGSIVEHIPSDCVNEDCDGVRFHGTGHVFKGNYIHDIKFTGDNEGYSPHIDGFQTFWWSGVQDSAQDCIFENNFIDLPYYLSEGASAKGWELEDARDLIIRNNLVKGNWGVRCEASNVKIFNNTLLGDINLVSGWQVGVRLHDSQGSMVHNNIIVGFNDMAIETTGTNTGSSLDYNCTFMWDESTPGGDPGAHDLWDVDPMFVNAARGDFSLKLESPCRDAAIDLGSSFDDGLHPESVWTNKVVTIDQDDHGNGWEMGAYIFLHEDPDTIAPDPPVDLKVIQAPPLF